MGYAFFYALRNAPANKPHPLWLCQLEEQWHETTHSADPGTVQSTSGGHASVNYDHALATESHANRRSWRRKPRPKTKGSDTPPKPLPIESTIEPVTAPAGYERHDSLLLDLEWEENVETSSLEVLTQPFQINHG